MEKYKKPEDNNGWIDFRDKLPTKADTSDELYNEVLTIQLGTNRPVMMKYWEVERSSFVTHWMVIKPPKINKIK